MAKSNAGKPRPDIALSNRVRSQALVEISDSALVEAAMEFFYTTKGTRAYPTDMQIVDHLRAKYDISTAKAVAVLRGMRVQIAERVSEMLPTMAQNVIADLSDQIRSAQRAGDHGAAIRGLIGLGRFVGLDQPQMTPDQQVRQLSDAALEAALSSSIARSLETMSEDQFADLMRRREAKRLAEARPGIIDAGAAEATK